MRNLVETAWSLLPYHKQQEWKDEALKKYDNVYKCPVCRGLLTGFHERSAHFQNYLTKRAMTLYKKSLTKKVEKIMNQENTLDKEGDYRIAVGKLVDFIQPPSADERVGKFANSRKKKEDTRETVINGIMSLLEQAVHSETQKAEVEAKRKYALKGAEAVVADLIDWIEENNPKTVDEVRARATTITGSIELKQLDEETCLQSQSEGEQGAR